MTNSAGFFHSTNHKTYSETLKLLLHLDLIYSDHMAESRCRDESKLLVVWLEVLLVFIYPKWICFSFLCLYELAHRCLKKKKSQNTLWLLLALHLANYTMNFNRKRYKIPMTMEVKQHWVCWMLGLYMPLTMLNKVRMVHSNCLAYYLDPSNKKRC